MSIVALMNETCDVLRPTERVRASGVVSPATPVTIATGVACALQQKQPRGRMRQTDAGKASMAVWLGFFPATLDLRENDRVIRNGQTFEVTDVENLRDHHVEAQLRKVVGA